MREQSTQTLHYAAFFGYFLGGARKYRPPAGTGGRGVVGATPYKKRVIPNAVPHLALPKGELAKIFDFCLRGLY